MNEISSGEAVGLLQLFRADIGLEERLAHFSAATEVVCRVLRKTT